MAHKKLSDGIYDKIVDAKKALVSLLMGNNKRIRALAERIQPALLASERLFHESVYWQVHSDYRSNMWRVEYGVERMFVLADNEHAAIEYVRRYLMETSVIAYEECIDVDVRKMRLDEKIVLRYHHGDKYHVTLTVRECIFLLNKNIGKSWNIVTSSEWKES